MDERNKGTPRPASTYRAARRNKARELGLFPVWRQKSFAGTKYFPLPPVRENKRDRSRDVIVNATKEAA